MRAVGRCWRLVAHTANRALVTSSSGRPGPLALDLLQDRCCWTLPGAGLIVRHTTTDVGSCESGLAYPPMPMYYADWAEVKLPEKHRFPMDKYKATRLIIENDPTLIGLFAMMKSPLASMSDILAVHDHDYATKYLAGQLSELEQRTIGFPWSPANVKRSLASTGGTVACMHAVVGGGFPAAAQIAGGTHHAFAGHGEGFCVFNDIAVAASAALRTYGEEAVAPILVIDLDVHQGNGTAAIFEDDDRVVTFDMYGDNNYPWRSRMENTYDVPLRDYVEDMEYLAILDEWLPLLFDRHQPKLVFFQAGVDALAEDSFGRLSMTRQGMMERNLRVYNECIKREVPCVITMGGGYSRPMDMSVNVHADVYSSAIRVYAKAFEEYQRSTCNA